ncbi:MAG: outer membrane beta-barrel protein [Chitinophagaceae bacterium]|nr:outer membrane beta-barrel protein [Chitinophagaceae bacterium]
MKQLFTLMALVAYCTLSAQPVNDSIRVGNMIIITKGDKNAGKENKEEYTMAKVDSTINGKPGDTIHVGNIVIVTNGEKDNRTNPVEKIFERRHRDKPSNVSTNWFILDLGFSNYVDKTTDYSTTGTGGYLFNRPGIAPLGQSDFELNTGKSINVNIWFFMQRFNLIKHHLHLKYGLGLELNNYRYKSQVSYLKENPFVTGVAPAPAIIRDSISFSKNKLAADYITVPLMLNFSTNPNRQNKGFSISLGVSAGYLYAQRNKQISDERGKKKTKDGLGLEQFKLSYIGEIGLGPVRLYGSYSPSSFYKKGLDMRPFTLGIRLSNW